MTNLPSTESAPPRPCHADLSRLRAVDCTSIAKTGCKPALQRCLCGQGDRPIVGINSRRAPMQFCREAAHSSYPRVALTVCGNGWNIALLDLDTSRCYLQQYEVNISL